jgi:PKHD-type hydroxylase
MSHSYKTIYNWPTERQRKFYNWVFWDNAFSSEELDNIIKLMDAQNLERATTIGGAKKQKWKKGGYVNPVQEEEEIVVSKQNPNQAINEKVRKSDVKFIDFANGQGPADWIYYRLNNVIENLNNQFYNFDLNGYETFQYTVYHHHENGRYDFHMDTIMGQNLPDDMYETRKLSMTFLLNEPGADFEGGDFQINSGQEKDAETVPLNKGRIIMFPSFMIHRVAPVTKGTRKSIVIWVLGPKFR